MRWFLVSAVLFLVACGGGGHDEPAQCATPSGDYRFHYAKTSGNCADIPDLVTAIGDGSAGTPANCTASYTDSANKCHSTVRLTCNEAQGTTRTNVAINLAEDGRTGDGTFDITLTNRDGAVVCDGGYDVTLTKL